MNIYPFIEAEKAEQDGNVAMACRLLEVSRTAYYEWSSTGPSARELSDGELTERIKQIHSKSGGSYGAPRITDELRDGHLLFMANPHPPITSISPRSCT